MGMDDPLVGVDGIGAAFYFSAQNSPGICFEKVSSEKYFLKWMEEWMIHPPSIHPLPTFAGPA